MFLRHGWRSAGPEGRHARGALASARSTTKCAEQQQASQIDGIAARVSLHPSQCDRVKRPAFALVFTLKISANNLAICCAHGALKAHRSKDVTAAGDVLLIPSPKLIMVSD